jgi:hypothetical protein
MPSIYRVNPWDIDLSNEPQIGREVRTQINRLLAEGQIEPIEVIRNPLAIRKLALAPDGWVYAAAQIQAARELQWPTILVTY